MNSPCNLDEIQKGYDLQMQNIPIKKWCDCLLDMLTGGIRIIPDPDLSSCSQG